MLDHPKETSVVLLLTARDAARALAISERKLWQLTLEDEIPIVRAGRSIRYDVEDLRAWIEKQKTRREPAPGGPNPRRRSSDAAPDDTGD